MKALCVLLAILASAFLLQPFEMKQSKKSINSQKIEISQKFRLNQKPSQTLRVSAIHNEPFFNARKISKHPSGVEAKLIKTIAEKENMDLSIEVLSQLNSADINLFASK